VCAVRNINENLENSKILNKMCTRAECKVNWPGSTFIYLHFHCMFFFFWKGFQVDEFVFIWYVKLRLCVLCKFVWAEFHNANLHNIRTFCIVWIIQLNICSGRCYVGVSWKARGRKEHVSDVKPLRQIIILSHDGVTIDGVWIGNRIYLTLTERNYK
jgi:hypothetical protein